MISCRQRVGKMRRIGMSQPNRNRAMPTPSSLLHSRPARHIGRHVERDAGDVVLFHELHELITELTSVRMRKPVGAFDITVAYGDEHVVVLVGEQVTMCRLFQIL